MRATQSGEAAESYDTVSIAFHWATVLIVLSLFLLALVPGVVKGSIELHKSLGFAVFALVFLRILWRLVGGRTPVRAGGEPALLRLGARVAHQALYALLLTAPVLGWLYLEAKAIDVHPFGISWIEMPSLIYYDRPLAMEIYGWKKVVVYSLLALILLHAAAAIVYHSTSAGTPCCTRCCRAAGAAESPPWSRWPSSSPAPVAPKLRSTSMPSPQRWRHRSRSPVR